MQQARHRATRNPELISLRAAMAAQQQLLNLSLATTDERAISAFIDSYLRSSAVYFSGRCG
jgi:hypothetical protein